MFDLHGGFTQGSAHITVGDQTRAPFHQAANGTEEWDQAVVFVWERYG
jgi:hypothetical protein